MGEWSTPRPGRFTPSTHCSQVAVATKLYTAAPNMCVTPGYGFYLMSTFWRLEFWGGTYVFGDFVYSCSVELQ
jgi:hypothetical protein